MKPKKFEIVFDNTQGVFTAGLCVSGNLLLHLLHPMKVKSIKIQCTGYAKTHWSSWKDNNSASYASVESYIDTQLVLYEHDPDDGDAHLRGHRAFPFTLLLPESLPSSYEGLNGHIRYMCKATIERPWYDSHVSRAFTVIHHLDLSLMPALSIPYSAQKANEVYGCCGSAGFVDIYLNLNKIGYVPGEPIQYTIAVQNRSTETVNEVSLVLKQLTSCTGLSSDFFLRSGKLTKHQKLQHFNLLYTKCHFKPNTSKQIKHSIALPSLPPSKLDGCQIIDVNYSLELRVLCGSAFTIEREIIVGTIPTQGARIQSTLSLSTNNRSSVMPPSYSEVMAAPPSYAECAHNPTSSNNNGGNTRGTEDINFVPSYPYYDFEARPQQTDDDQSEDLMVGAQESNDNRENEEITAEQLRGDSSVPEAINYEDDIYDDTHL